MRYEFLVPLKTYRYHPIRHIRHTPPAFLNRSPCATLRAVGGMRTSISARCERAVIGTMGTQRSDRSGNGLPSTLGRLQVSFFAVPSLLSRANRPIVWAFKKSVAQPTRRHEMERQRCRLWQPPTRCALALSRSPPENRTSEELPMLEANSLPSSEQLAVL